MSSAVARSLRSAPASARRLPGRAVLSRARSTAAVGVADDAEPQGSLFNPTAEHYALRELCAAFVRDEVEPQALEFNRAERFNHPLFRRAGELGLLGVTVDPEYGGAGMDAAAACIVHEELSASDPAFCLSYLAHSQLFVNNLARNGSAEQKAAWLPAACSGEAIGGMGMSEPEAGTDVLGMRTRAEQQADGSWLLNGGKMWITNGAVSDTELGDRCLIVSSSSSSRSRRLRGSNNTHRRRTASERGRGVPKEAWVARALSLSPSLPPFSLSLTHRRRSAARQTEVRARWVWGGNRYLI